MSIVTVQDERGFDRAFRECDECFTREPVTAWPLGSYGVVARWSYRYVTDPKRVGISIQRDLCTRCTPLHLCLRPPYA